MPKAINERRIRILVADDETLLSQRLIDYLTEKGFDVQHVRSGHEVMESLDSWYPDFIVYDLMLPEINAIAFLKNMKDSGRLGAGKLKVMVTSGHNNKLNIQECMRLGAADYLPKPIVYQDLLARIILQIQTKREIGEYRARGEDDFKSANYFIHLTDLSLREALKPAVSEETLHNLSGMIGLAMKAVRVSCIRCDMVARRGWVIASSDKRSIGRLEIDLGKYPEIMYVLTNQKLLALDNLAADPTMHFVRRLTKAITFNSMVVAPIRINNELWGVLSIRMPENKKSLAEFEIRFAQLVAHVMGLVIRQEPEILTIPQTDPNEDPGQNRNSA